MHKLITKRCVQEYSQHNDSQEYTENRRSQGQSPRTLTVRNPTQEEEPAKESKGVRHEIKEKQEKTLSWNPKEEKSFKQEREQLCQTLLRRLVR